MHKVQRCGLLLPMFRGLLDMTIGCAKTTWVVDSGGLKEPCTRWGPNSSTGMVSGGGALPCEAAFCQTACCCRWLTRLRCGWYVQTATRTVVAAAPPRASASAMLSACPDTRSHRTPVSVSLPVL